MAPRPRPAFRPGLIAPSQPVCAASQLRLSPPPPSSLISCVASVQPLPANLDDVTASFQSLASLGSRLDGSIANQQFDERIAQELIGQGFKFVGLCFANAGAVNMAGLLKAESALKDLAAKVGTNVPPHALQALYQEVIKTGRAAIHK